MLTRYRNWILPSLCLVVAVSLIVINSCAHSKGADDVDEAEATADQGANASASQDADTKDGTAAADDNATADTAGAAKDAPKDDALAELESTVGDQTKNQSAGNSGVETDSSMDHSAPSDSPSAGPDTAAATSPETAPAGTDTANNEVKPDADITAEAKPDASASTPPETTTAATVSKLNDDKTTADTSSSGAEISEGTPVIAEPEKPTAPEAPVAEKPSKVVVVHETHAPHIPGRALSRNGVRLNRFYFVRKGDTTKSVSSLLYGTPSRAAELSKWNAGKWAPGKLVYYQSPSDPKDRKMRSFYQERSVPVEEYTTKASDTLFSIAKKKLGSRSSWKEIAVVNGLDLPESLEKGQKLALYPSNLRQYSNPGSGGNENTTEPPAQSQPLAKQPVTPPPQQIQQTNEQPAPPPEVAPPVETKPVKNPGGFDIAKMVEQNLFAFGIGGMVFICLVLLMVLNRKSKSSNREEFADDGFSSSPKARRK